MQVPVPFVKGWRVVVRASRSADPTSVRLSYCSVIAQTRERNWMVPKPAGQKLRRFLLSLVTYRSCKLFFCLLRIEEPLREFAELLIAEETVGKPDLRLLHNGPSFGTPRAFQNQDSRVHLSRSRTVRKSPWIA